MLDEMEQVICRLHNFNPSSWAVQQLTRLHEYYRCELERIASCEEHPHVMRVLFEECIELVQGILDDIGVGAENDQLRQYPYWRTYLRALQSCELFDLELIRYRSAKTLADLFLQNSYICEDEDDYKQQRYAYVLEKLPLPEWFRLSEVIGWLEEIITAYFLLWFAVMDYIEDLSIAAVKGA